MAVITLEEFRPPRRYDSLVWTEARIEESATSDPDSAYTEVETLTLSPVDTDPEDPALRDLTTELASDTPYLWYRIVWVDANGDESEPTYPIQNSPPGDAYITVAELARVLKIREPSTEQETALSRVLLAAAGEINHYIDRSEDDPDLSGWQLALAQQVNLERAAELWKEQETQLGILMGIDSGAVYIARDTFEKFAIKLHPLKTRYGFA